MADQTGPVERGTVKCFYDERGFGFITCSDGSEIFVHFKSIQRKNKEYRTLYRGQIVEFVAVKTTKGWAAENVRVLRRSDTKGPEENKVGQTLRENQKRSADLIVQERIDREQSEEDRGTEVASAIPTGSSVSSEVCATAT